jgi:hypothetical protein
MVTPWSSARWSLLLSRPLGPAHGLRDGVRTLHAETHNSANHRSISACQASILLSSKSSPLSLSQPPGATIRMQPISIIGRTNGMKKLKSIEWSLEKSWPYKPILGTLSSGSTPLDLVAAIESELYLVSLTRTGAQSRRPMDMIFQGRSTSLFHA